ALPVGNSTELASTSGAVLDGKALYTQNCASCHGPVEASAKRSRTADQITLALSSQPLMGAIHLTQAQIELIALALSSDATTPPPVVNANNRLEFACTPGQLQKTPLVKLTNREYRNALFALLDGFATALKSDVSLVSQLDGIPTAIASV